MPAAAKFSNDTTTRMHLMVLPLKKEENNATDKVRGKIYDDQSVAV